MSDHAYFLKMFQIIKYNESKTVSVKLYLLGYNLE